MKTLELTTNKRLLIVEYATEKEAITNALLYSDANCNLIKLEERSVKFICKGPGLTEDIAMGLVGLHEDGYYKDYKNDNNFFTLPSRSFISAIESKGWYWGENPLKQDGTDGEAYVLDDIMHKEWQEAESRTFNPEKCIIVEIV